MARAMRDWQRPYAGRDMPFTLTIIAGMGLRRRLRPNWVSSPASGGWNACIADLREIRARIETEHPGVPVFLMGHSLGSFMVQQFIGQHGEGLAGAVLSATNGKPPAIAAIGGLLARLERLRIGARGRSALLNAMLFGAFNKPFAPARTPFDWLSRDPAEVGKYMADPLCGFIPAVQLFIDMLGGVTGAATRFVPGRHSENAAHLYLQRRARSGRQ